MSNTPASPFADIRDLLRNLPPPDAEAVAEVRTRDAQLTKPAGALGRLEEIVEWLAAWQGRAPPRMEQAIVAVFAGNHGVVKQGVAAYPPDVTRQMVANFRSGGAAINQLCKSFDLGLKVFELALEMPTHDITEEAALGEAECAATMAYGMEAVAGGIDLLCVGEMGIGNTTIAAALSHGLFGGQPEDWVGPGTGLDAEGVRRKADAVRRAVALHQAYLGDPLEALRRLGGRELAAMAGSILAARHHRVPVLIDGYVATAAAAVLHRANPAALDHCIAAHRSAEPAHGALLDRIGKKPLFDLGMRLGEGSAAALAAGMVKAAVAVHRGMATFADAGVSTKGQG
ncbi:MAG: nicotinate-nucleotide--dimethylbenzimidazole phosphoribosyltransferase [Pseudomonadota bacterium]|nr:nicotinate-nucleotide--dimethylbenzimidazole phosphoribosyltransferase [Pseudomonadota bacterium]